MGKLADQKPYRWTAAVGAVLMFLLCGILLFKGASPIAKAIGAVGLVCWIAAAARWLRTAPK